MYRTFNMGIGMIVAAARPPTPRASTAMLHGAGETRVAASASIVAGEPGVVYACA